MITFSELLKVISENENISPARMFDKLSESDEKVCKAAFYRYYKGEAIPKFSRAMVILKTFNYEMNENEVAQMLVDSERKLNTEHLKNEMLFTSIKVNYRKILNEPNTKELLNLRIEQTSEGITDYITKLIRKDLKEGILKEGEDYGVKEVLWIKK